MANIYLRWCLTALLAVISLSLETCKKKEETTPPPDDGEVILAPVTRIIKAADWEQYLVGIDTSANWTIRMDAGIRQTYNLQTGDIIVSTAGEGLLRKITGITETNGVLVCTTQQAAVAEALKKGTIRFHKDLSAQLKNARIIYHQAGVRLKETGREDKDIQMTFSLEVPIHEHITVKGELSVDPSISGEVEIEDYQLIFLNMEFIMEENFQLTTTADIASLKLEKEIPVATVIFPTFTVLVGVLPVLVTPQFTLKLGVSLDLKSELTVGVTHSLTTTTGLEYRNGQWDPYFTLKKDFGHTGPSLSNTLEAKAYVKPQLDMKFYGCVSPNLSLQLYGKVEATLGGNPWWELFAGLSADIGLDIKIWIFDIASFSVNLFDLKVPIADANGTGNKAPVASYVITPLNGSTATTFHFDASGSHDAEDPPEDLQVRWDWEGDGTWDTQFSETKEAFHKYGTPGSYFPKLQVKDSYNATDDSIRAVEVVSGQNQPPVAAFTVDPPTGAYTTVFHFDAATSHDEEDPVEILEVRWDWDNDGTWDTQSTREKSAVHQFVIGDHRILLEVKDSEGLTDTISVPIHVFNGNPTSFIIDPRDGKQYETVQIGDQWWMAQNLNYGVFIEGPNHMTNDTVPEKYCYDNSEFNCDVYGALYQWREAMDWFLEPGVQGACPPGWHIPSQTEWETLITYLGGDGVAGGKLKEAGLQHWKEPNAGATNLSGFTALPGGMRFFSGGVFGSLHTSARFWSSIQLSGNSSWSVNLAHDKESIGGTGGELWTAGYAVRCIKD